MKTIIPFVTSLSLCFFALCLSSCSDDDDEVEPSLSVSPTSVSVAAEGGSFSVTVTSNVEYTVSVSDDWLTLDSDSDGSLSFTAAANSAESSRTATITISAEEVSGTVKVAQEGVSLSVDPTSVSVAAEGGSFSVTVTSNVEYTVSVSDEWLTLDSDSDGSLSFTATANSAGARAATITISAGEASSTVDVTQEGAYDVSGTIDGYEYVDLGLSVKWAVHNVGAESPEDYGDYYAWGEIETKSTYKNTNSDTYGESIDDISGNSGYDVACARWGESWRIPTYDECNELCTDCTWTWTTMNEVKGYEVTGVNGNSIFLPAAGYMSNSSVGSSGSNGSYWTSTPGSNSSYAYQLLFYSSSYEVYLSARYFGYPVRPVSE